MPLTLRYAARSDVGLVREGNEDSGYAGPHLLAVADGMGGHAAGEVASRAAIDELVNADQMPDGDPIDVLSAAVSAANGRINDMARSDPSRAGMGTTSTALLWNGVQLALGHIGDSRAYLLRDGSLTQITRDHTFVQSLVDDGRITPEDAREHPARSVVTKVLQGQSPIHPDYSIIDVQAGDRVLICSDGLSDVITDHDIETTLAGAHTVDDAADQLIAMALDAGAPDNVTVVIGELVEADTAGTDATAETFIVGSAAESIEDGRSPEFHEDPETMRYAPRAPRRRRRRWLRPALAVAAVMVVGWAGLTYANGWVRDQYYIGVSGGQVAIYQGVRHELGPVHLSELYDVPGGLPLEALPTVYRDEVGETIAADDLDDAEQVIHTLRLRACRAHQRETTQTNAGDESLSDDVGFPGLLCSE
ncbi:Stp1/IreP family PP2C-type Ser/Thr phosphatase [Jiangella aurantiaca]|uniref:Serine/threonine protein phosphatase PstP n=1 Tax=Jiangella aurantiaca TaxID=2530373 RepID=A0A4R5ALG2_9ACTN|nr:Stp1/IreP family PP2C-type Ser/Thr phosphatase [Jiangella aurantiaca]TDD72339.1 Stp1/IreP family PP2C-type Ser/Thr phosphatase [Jiangella aurantiaca]